MVRTGEGEGKQIKKERESVKGRQKKENVKEISEREKGEKK